MLTLSNSAFSHTIWDQLSDIISSMLSRFSHRSQLQYQGLSDKSTGNEIGKKMICYRNSYNVKLVLVDIPASVGSFAKNVIQGLPAVHLRKRLAQPPQAFLPVKSSQCRSARLWTLVIRQISFRGMVHCKNVSGKYAGGGRIYMFPQVKLLERIDKIFRRCFLPAVCTGIVYLRFPHLLFNCGFRWSLLKIYLRPFK